MRSSRSFTPSFPDVTFIHLKVSRIILNFQTTYQTLKTQKQVRHKTHKTVKYLNISQILQL